MLKEPSPIVVALIRAAIGAVIAAGAVYFSDVNVEWRTVLAAAFSYIAVRAGAEGWYDQSRKPLQNEPPASELDS